MAGRDLQVQHRPRARSQDPRRRRALPAATGQGRGAVWGDERSQVQALERTAPILPIRPGLPEKATHGYIRHGTTTLFAALEVATGRVVNACFDRHRHQEFLKFLKQVAKAYPRIKLHLVVDNYATHKHPVFAGELLEVAESCASIAVPRRSTEAAFDPPHMGLPPCTTTRVHLPRPAAAGVPCHGRPGTWYWVDRSNLRDTPPSATAIVWPRPAQSLRSAAVGVRRCAGRVSDRAQYWTECVRRDGPICTLEDLDLTPAP